MIQLCLAEEYICTTKIYSNLYYTVSENAEEMSFNKPHPEIGFILKMALMPVSAGIICIYSVVGNLSIDYEHRADYLPVKPPCSSFIATHISNSQLGFFSPKVCTLTTLKYATFHMKRKIFCTTDRF